MKSSAKSIPDITTEELHDLVRNLESRVIELESVIAALDPKMLPPTVQSIQNRIKTRKPAIS